MGWSFERELELIPYKLIGRRMKAVKILSGAPPCTI
jgi:hypothetical protein